jgi:hypothetical protein
MEPSRKQDGEWNWNSEVAWEATGERVPAAGETDALHGCAVGSAEGSTPSLHNGAQQPAQLIEHQTSSITIRADVVSHIFLIRKC